MEKRKGLDIFIVKEVEGEFFAQQQIHVTNKNYFTGRIRSEKDVWETIFHGDLVYLEGEYMWNNFKTKKLAKMAINHYRKENGFKKRDIKIHKYEEL